MKSIAGVDVKRSTFLSLRGMRKRYWLFCDSCNGTLMLHPIMKKDASVRFSYLVALASFAQELGVTWWEMYQESLSIEEGEVKKIHGLVNRLNETHLKEFTSVA